VSLIASRAKVALYDQYRRDIALHLSYRPQFLHIKSRNAHSYLKHLSIALTFDVGVVRLSEVGYVGVA
jgi:hypothetical protein